MAFILSSSKQPAGSNFHYYHLPKGMLKLKITAKQNPATGRESFSMDHSRVLIPDPEHRYYLKYHGSVVSDDQVNVLFHENGYLKKIEAISDDKTVEIVDAISKVLQTAAGVPAIQDRSLEKARVLYDSTFDPFNAYELKRVNEELQQHNPELQLTWKMIEHTYDGEPPQSVDDSGRKGGIFCRPVIPCELGIGVGKSIQREYINMPHPTLLHMITVPKARFVKSEFLMEFDELGHPINIQYKKPSQALAFVELPLKIISAIIALPSKLVQLRINYDSARMGDQQSMLESKQRMQKQEAELAQMREQLNKQNKA